jgi:hypothetical protein
MRRTRGYRELQHQLFQLVIDRVDSKKLVLALVCWAGGLRGDPDRADVLSIYGQCRSMKGRLEFRREILQYPQRFLQKGRYVGQGMGIGIMHGQDEMGS